MNILILGGTQFVGRHLVEAALNAGHSITLFNRGRTNPGLYPDAEEICGDRDGGLDPLKGRAWDAVIDCCGYVPRIARQSAELLRDAVELYGFISSISVYAKPDAMKEGDPVQELEDPTTEEVMAHYGALKVACEHAIGEIYGERSLIVRPGFIAGPYDPVARLPYLLQRFDADGERLAGRPEQPVQFIHARDLGEWILRAVENRLNGVYNLTGHPFPMRELLDAIIAATARDISVTHTDDAFLRTNAIRPIDGLTFWVPQEREAIMRLSIERALNAGLKLRPMRQTIDETLAWVRKEKPQYDSVFAGDLDRKLLTLEQEACLLKEWRAQSA